MKTKTKPGSDCGCDDYADAVHGNDDGDFAALADVEDEHADDLSPDPRGTTVRRFKRQLIAPYGKPTGDKRRFKNGSLTSRPLPYGLKWQREDNQGHSTSVTVGRIDAVDFDEDGPDGPGVYGTGIFFQPDPEKMPRWAEDCEEAFNLTKESVIGPSVDLDAMDFHEYTGPAEGEEEYAAAQRPDIEVTRGRISSVTLVQIPAFAEARPFAIEEQDATEYAAELEAYATAITASGVYVHDETMPVAAVDWDLEHWITEGSAYEGAALYSGADGDMFPVADVVDGQLSLIPGAVADAIGVFAHQGERIALPEAAKQVLRDRLADLAVLCDLPTPPWVNDPGALVAAGTIDGWLPDREAFENPNLDGPTPITVRDGRVFGHVATWGACHIGFKHCVQPPRSAKNYAHFHVGEIETTDGPLAVGKITLGGGHADTQLGFKAAAEHYDDAGTAVAAVRAGEDAHGIWISGVALPGREADFATLPLFPLSGDWRRVGGSMEMIAALAVNTPGFGIPRVSQERGRELALVAAGALLPEHEADGDLVAFRDVSQKMRDKLASKGQANPDGSYPIANVEDLKNAISAYGRAGDKPATKALIIKMAKKLKRKDLIPEGWESAGSGPDGDKDTDDYAITDAELDLVRAEWAAEMAAVAFEDGAVTAAGAMKLHAFVRKLCGHHMGDGGDAGMGGKRSAAHRPVPTGYAADDVVAAFRREAEAARQGRILAEGLEELAALDDQARALAASQAF